MRVLFFVGNILSQPLANHALYALMASTLVRVIPATLTNKNSKEHREKKYFLKYGDDKSDMKRKILKTNLIKDQN